jgi:hypothetical protein
MRRGREARPGKRGRREMPVVFRAVRARAIFLPAGGSGCQGCQYVVAHIVRRHQKRSYPTGDVDGLAGRQPVFRELTPVAMSRCDESAFPAH